MWDTDSLFRRVYELPYGSTTSFQLFDAAKNSKKFIQKLRLQVKLPVHNGCVNSICWNNTGEFLLSGSDDQHLCITHGYKHTVLANIQTGHRANIFSAKFLPNTGDIQVISCSGDGIVIYSDLEHSETSMQNIFSCHFGTAYEIMTVPNDPHTFLSCGEDGTVRWFDLRAKTRCVLEECKEDILLNCRCAVTSLAVNPFTPYQLAVGCADASVRIFDRRMLGTKATGNFMGSGIQAMMAYFTVPEFNGHNRRITSLCYSPDGREMLVSYSSDYIYLFDVKDDFEKEPKVLRSESPGQESDKSSKGKGRSRSRPVMKRLRVRGDWSDTGPNARPESESRGGEQQPRSLHASLMQRMSDVLTRMFNNPARVRQRSAASRSSSASSQISSHSASEEEVSEEEGRGSRQGESAHPEEGVDLTKEGSDKKETEEKNSAADSRSGDTEPIHELCQSDISGATSTCLQNSENLKAEEPEEMEVDSDHEKPGSEVLNLSLQDLEHELSSRRQDLIQRHQVEPMVNLHFTGEGVNSGIITMNVASTSGSRDPSRTEQSSEPQTSQQNENLAQNTEKEETNNLISKECTDVNDNESSQSHIVESKTETSETLDVCDTALSLVTSSENDLNSNIAHSSDTHTQDASQQEKLENTPETSTSFVKVPNETPTECTCSNVGQQTPVINIPQDDEEPALLMEMDTWDVDSSSDDEQTRQRNEERPSQRSNRRNSESGPESILRSIDEELKCRREELRKEKVQMMNVPQPRVRSKFTGHRNARTMIKEATFWGDNFIMSGSDCGHIFVWDRYTTELVMLMEADHHVVNCLQPHPFDPILASSGIDYDIKLWAPLRDEPFFDAEKASEIVKRNEVMLEETKDTITVPASFMIRMLASLNHIRS